MFHVETRLTNRFGTFIVRMGKDHATVEREGEALATEPGVGTVIAKVTTAAGVKPCGGCKKRQAQLDKATPGWLRRFIGKVLPK
jgi:hypothetical protein